VAKVIVSDCIATLAQQFDIGKFVIERIVGMFVKNNGKLQNQQDSASEFWELISLQQSLAGIY